MLKQKYQLTKKILLSLLCFNAPSQVFAEVNLLTGAYLLKVDTIDGVLVYDSRNNRIADPAFGWSWKHKGRKSNCKLEVKNYLLTAINCTERNSASQIWSFKYDSQKNLIYYAKNGNRKEEIFYNRFDSVNKVATDNCQYEFKFHSGDSKNFQTTETTSWCKNKHKQHEITIFSLKKNKSQAYTPILIKKIGGSLALQNRP